MMYVLAMTIEIIAIVIRRHVVVTQRLSVQAKHVVVILISVPRMQDTVHAILIGVHVILRLVAVIVMIVLVIMRAAIAIVIDIVQEILVTAIVIDVVVIARLLLEIATSVVVTERLVDAIAIDVVATERLVLVMGIWNVVVTMNVVEIRQRLVVHVIIYAIVNPHSVLVYQYVLAKDMP